MPKFTVRFERTYEIFEGFDRVIEAPSKAEALAAAAILAWEFNDDCPDDCTESGTGGPGAGEFHAELVPGVPSEAPDYVVLPDGQIVPPE